MLLIGSNQLVVQKICMFLCLIRFEHEMRGFVSVVVVLQSLAFDCSSADRTRM